ncbi:MAG: hypothetical protein RBS89_07220 [Candidatus Delongbacteria bacterium]|jgi:hypothetical protein|nr:hypothetical protein [Candidatus Delongbacteria bacterium]
MNFNEHELIKKFIVLFIGKCKKVYDLDVAVRNVTVEKPVPTEDYKEYKDGKSSTNTEIGFELLGWKAFSDNALKNFMTGLLEEDEAFTPIVNIEVYDIQSKGKTNVKVTFSMVYAKYDVTTEGKVAEDLKTGAIDKNDVINEIELRLSEIYTLLKKLRS